MKSTILAIFKCIVSGVKYISIVQLYTFFIFCVSRCFDILKLSGGEETAPPHPQGYILKRLPRAHWKQSFDMQSDQALAPPSGPMSQEAIFFCRGPGCRPAPAPSASWPTLLISFVALVLCSVSCSRTCEYAKLHFPEPPRAPLVAAPDWPSGKEHRRHHHHPSPEPFSHHPKPKPCTR